MTLVRLTCTDPAFQCCDVQGESLWSRMSILNVSALSPGRPPLEAFSQPYTCNCIFAAWVWIIRCSYNHLLIVGLVENISYPLPSTPIIIPKSSATRKHRQPCSRLQISRALLSSVGLASLIPQFLRLTMFPEDADPYIPGGGGAQWFVNQNNLYVN